MLLNAGRPLLPTPNRGTDLISTRPPISIMIYPNLNKVDSPEKDDTSIQLLVLVMVSYFTPSLRLTSDTAETEMTWTANDR